MLTESKRNSIGEVIDKLTRLDKVGMMIIMSNAMALLARQELDKDNASQDTKDILGKQNLDIKIVMILEFVLVFQVLILEI